MTPAKEKKLTRMESSIGIVMNVKSIPDIELISDEDIEEESFTTTDLLQASEQDDVSNSLLKSGTMTGVAAAAALVASRKRQQNTYRFEQNASQRRRHHTRLIRKLKHTIHELCTRCGQQAVVVCVSPGKSHPTYRVFGSSPLDQVVKNAQDMIFRGLEKELQDKIQSNVESNGLFDLPTLNIDGIPTSVEEMNQSQLRMFIPEMLKYSLGRGKPGWGKESKKPVWWPHDVPWANVRRDDRTQEAKIHVSWTQALRQIVKNCYRYHGREDLLRLSTPVQEMQPSSNDSKDKMLRSTAAVVSPPTLVQTVHNSDGSVSLIEVDSGQTIATISRDQSGTAVATFAGSVTDDNQVNLSLDEVADTSWTITSHGSAIDEAYGGITNVDVDLSDVKQENESLLTFSDHDQVVDTSMEAVVTLPSHIGTSVPMVQIPISVYEKLAHTIEQTGTSPTVSISPDGRIQLQTEVDIPLHQKSVIDNQSSSQEVGGLTSNQVVKQ